MSKRDTQFAGFAKLLFDDVVDMFSNRYIELDNCEEQQAEKTKQGIIDCFAQCAYDLVQHALSNEKLQWRPLEDISVSDIPDMTEWGEQQEEGEQ